MHIDFTIASEKSRIEEWTRSAGQKRYTNKVRVVRYNITEAILECPTQHNALKERSLAVASNSC